MVATVTYIEAGLYSILAIALIIPLVSMATSRTSRLVHVLAWLAVFIFALVAIATYTSTPLNLYGGVIQHDKFTALLLNSVALTAAISLLSANKEPAYWESSPAYYSLLPLALFGTFFLLGAADALTVLATWLLVSIISYVMLALPADKASRGAAVQYIFIGAIATLFLAIWVGGEYVLSSQAGRIGFTITSLTLDKFSALVLITAIAALGFKIGIVPFHWWLPSVYSKGNGYMVSVVTGMIKIAFIGLVARVILNSSLNPLVSGNIALILAALAVLTMTYGNVAALTTRNLQKLLAYSSVAQVGYILVGLTALAYLAGTGSTNVNLALAAIVIHATAYGVAKAALFPLNVDEKSLDKLRGLLSKDKLAAASTAILLLSLLGLPPLLGFWGKFYLFYAASSYSIILVAIALVNSAISSAYYVRAIRELVASEPTEVTPRWHVVAAVLIAALATLALGFIAPYYVTSLS